LTHHQPFSTTNHNKLTAISDPTFWNQSLLIEAGLRMIADTKTTGLCGDEPNLKRTTDQDGSKIKRWYINTTFASSRRYYTPLHNLNQNPIKVDLQRIWPE